MATMADEGTSMDATVPSKRPRLDLSSEYEEGFQSETTTCIPESSDIISGIHGESASTSDSGFNEFTPPQSFEEDGISAGTSSNNLKAFDHAFDIPSLVNGPSTSSESPKGENKEEEDDDDTFSVSSTASNISGFSDLSNLSGRDWKPCAGPMSWVQQQMTKGVNPRSVLTHILGNSCQIPEGVSDFMLWHIIVNMLSEPPKRERLRHVNRLEDVIRLIKSCRKIVVLTGAGVSVSCGIPDFRSKDGIYARLAVDFPDLPDPQAMFDIHYFRKDPRPFFKFAKEIYPGQFTPSLCHKFIRLLEQHNRLLRNYTQNIDTLEQVAGIENVIQCHGSFAEATCQRCTHKVTADEIKEDIFNQRIPKCSVCLDRLTTNTQNDNAIDPDSSSTSESLFNEASSVTTKENLEQSPASLRELSSFHGNSSTKTKHSSPDPDPIMKPNIVFFGEGLPDEFHDKMAEDKDECDLLIVIGSSLKVRPVALIPSSIPSNVPQILINREPLNHLTFDVELLGDCDVIIGEICRRLGDTWDHLISATSLEELKELPPRVDASGIRQDSESTSSPLEAPHPKDEKDIEALRACWAPKVKESMAARLPKNSYFYGGGHRYVFPGAEVYYDPDDEHSDSQSTSSSSSSSSDSDMEDIDETLPSKDTEETPQSSARDDVTSPEGCALIGVRRRSSQALSEDIDSLLSTPSGVSNTPDHPVEGPSWSTVEGLQCSSTDSPSGEDWTSLRATLDSSGLDRFDISHNLPDNAKERSHHTECRV